jgi:hypothetical protein
MDYPRTSTEGQVMGIIGIVLGILSLIVAFIPCVGIVAFFPGALAVVFSIISIVQASNGNGKKGLGIAALVISIVSIVIAAVWLIIISGTAFVADEVFNKSEKFQVFGKEFKDAFEKEMGDEVDRKAIVDSLEKALQDLEKDLDEMGDTTIVISDKEAARKAGEAAAKALKKAAEGLKDRTQKLDSTILIK